MRRARSSIMANPVLVGAVTVLVLVVAVFLSYNANTGLPFVPTYDLEVDVPDAAELVPGNDVRIGGSRVGVVKEIEALPGLGPGATPGARLSISLEEAARPLAADTRAVIRQRSNLGLKYLELLPGRSARTLPADGRIPLGQVTGVVAFDEAISAFDAPTRAGLRSVVRELGAGLAGRDVSINRALEELPRGLPALATVARTLRAGSTDLPGFLRGTRAAMGTLAPVAGDLAGLLAAGATTFDALADERGAVSRALELGPGVTSDAQRGFAAARPLFREAAGLLADAEPASRVLRTSAGRLAAGLERSGRTLQRGLPLARDLSPVFAGLRTLARRPSLAPALQDLTDTARQASPALTAIAPFQTVCNYLGLWGRNVPQVVSEGDALGTWFRFILVAQLQEQLQSPRPSPTLHQMPSPDAGQGGECEAGNETFVPGQQLGPGVPGTQPGATEATAPPAEARR